MSESLVVAICLTADRPEMLARAVRCFEAQTYPNKRMLVWDSTAGLQCCNQIPRDGVMRVLAVPESGIGALRNAANFFASLGDPKPDIFMHMDDDDWSHPARMAEQVELLQESGADAVGYSDCLFCDTRTVSVPIRQLPDGGLSLGPHSISGEAWIYRAAKPNYAVGTSLMYWRRTWETKPFPALAKGEDTEWQRHMSVRAVSSRRVSYTLPSGIVAELPVDHPRIVAAIHGRNTSMQDYSTLMQAAGASEQGSAIFGRAPEWDKYCRALFEEKRELVK